MWGLRLDPGMEKGHQWEHLGNPNEAYNLVNGMVAVLIPAF